MTDTLKRLAEVLEARKGAARGHRNVFGIILGTGVGGGLLIDGQLVQGAGGYADCGAVVLRHHI